MLASPPEARKKKDFKCLDTQFDFFTTDRINIKDRMWSLRYGTHGSGNLNNTVTARGIHNKQLRGVRGGSLDTLSKSRLNIWSHIMVVQLWWYDGVSGIIENITPHLSPEGVSGIIENITPHLSPEGHLKYPNNLDQSLNDPAEKIRKYRADYNNRASSVVSFIPAIPSTSGRLHSEFVRLLFLQDHRETDHFFAASGVQSAQSNSGFFHFRRAAFLQHLKSKVGLALAKPAA